MKPPPDHPDSLLKSLSDEAGDLPIRAAAQARRSHACRTRWRRQSARAMGILVFAACAWLVFRPRNESREVITMHRISVEPSGLAPSPLGEAQPREYVRIQTEEQAKDERLPLPGGLSKEQQDLFEAARGLPLLLVRDSAGKVTRIHVIER